MTADTVESRARWPWHAIVVVAGAWLLAFLQVGLGALLGVFFVPLAPLTLWGGACLLSAAHEYADSQARTRAPKAVPLAGHEPKDQSPALAH